MERAKISCPSRSRYSSRRCPPASSAVGPRTRMIEGLAYLKRPWLSSTAITSEVFSIKDRKCSSLWRSLSSTLRKLAEFIAPLRYHVQFCSRLITLLSDILGCRRQAANRFCEAASEDPYN